MKILQRIITVLLAIIFIVSFYQYSTYYLAQKKRQEAYQNIRETVIKPTQEDDSFPASQDETESSLHIDFESLTAINPDVWAWIYLEDTDISYPVVQGTDNEYYLNHLITGEYNIAGSIFLDYENHRDLSNKNSILYGHHVDDGSMFSDLHLYKNQAFYDSHPAYELITANMVYQVEIFAGYVANTSQSAWRLDFQSDEEYRSWIREIKNQSFFISSVTPEAQDKVITLSTCSFEYDDARFVLHGVLRELHSNINNSLK